MSKKINAPGPSNGVYGADGVFYPNGSTPGKAAGDIDNPRAYGGDDDAYSQDEQVVGAPTPEQIAEAERQAAAQTPAPAPTSDGGDASSDDSAKPAKKAAAKKAPAKRAASSS